jgi:GT2 family glycosyltransferase/SAM-dependent methyltransferase
MSSVRLTAIVLTYNGRHLLETALPSFAAQDYRDWRLLVVDNGSTDDTREWLAANAPDAELLSLPQNIGVTAALNRGVQAANSELVALFNNDVELDPSCLTELVRAMDAHPEAGSAGAKLVDFTRRDVLDGAGDVMSWSGVAARRGHGARDSGQYEVADAVFSACGAAAIYRRSALEQVGPFDERFFSSLEDVDWGFRAQLAGYKARYVPTAIVYHMGSATIGAQLSESLAYQLWRNGVWLVAKNYPASALLRHAPRLLATQAINLAVALRDRMPGVWFRAWAAALQELPAVLRERRGVQRSRRISAAEIDGIVATTRARSAEPARDDVGRCPLCGGTAALAFTARDRNRELSDEPFRYRRCEACRAYSLIDVPADLGRFYPSEYYEFPDVAQLEALAPAQGHKLDLLRRIATPPGRLVEVGPGSGAFAYAACRAGYDVTVIEMDERVCRHLRDTLGIAAVRSARPEEALGGLSPSRAIAMWHVIEHVPEPWALLDASAANLEPGGVLAVATPNPDSLQFRLLGARWAHVDAPRHLFLLPLDALRKRAQAAGLRLAEVTTSDPDGRHWNRFGWEYALRGRPAAGPASRAVSGAALGLTLGMRSLEHSGLRGAAYTAVFVKDA